MLNTEPAQGSQNQNQQEFGVSQRSLHDDQYPFLAEFSQFLSTVSTKSLKYKLMSHQQRLLAKTLWEAANYGGSIAKCKEQLEKIYGDKWGSLTRLDEHMEDERVYCEYVLVLEHIRQWDKHNKLAKLQTEKQ